MKNGTVAVGNTDMYYVSFGRGKKNLVVLPGLSDGLATVKGRAAFLAPYFKVFFENYRVYLFSRKNSMPQGYSIRQMAADQAAVMNTLGIGKAAVLGVSQGGMIAQYLAIDHPELVEKLVLAVTAPYANDVVKNAVTAWVDMARRGDHAAFTVDSAEKTYSDAYLEKKRRLLSSIAKITKPKSYERFFRNAEAILHFDARDDLPAIRCPTLIISGAEDKTVGRDAAQELHERIPGSRSFVYEGLGHGAFEEAKDFYDRVFAFCEEE